MKAVIPAIQSTCEVVGRLYYSNDPRDLGEDMLDVSLPNGLLISAGWFPEGDPDGEYVVTVSAGLDVVGPPYRTKDVNEARVHVESLAKIYSDDVFPIVNSDDAVSIKYYIRRSSESPMFALK